MLIDHHVAADEPLLTAKQVSKMLAMQTQTLALWRMYGVGPPFVKLGRTVRYRRADVLLYIASAVRGSGVGNTAVTTDVDPNATQSGRV